MQQIYTKKLKVWNIHTWTNALSIPIFIIYLSNKCVTFNLVNTVNIYEIYQINHSIYKFIFYNTDC